MVQSFGQTIKVVHFGALSFRSVTMSRDHNSGFRYLEPALSCSSYVITAYSRLQPHAQESRNPQHNCIVSKQKNHW